MVKHYEPSQQELLDAIESTINVWKTLHKETLIKGNFICPLCSLIKTVFRVSFHKGSARGACVLCPMKHVGLFHICVGIQHVYSNTNLTDNEMKSLVKTVNNSLKLLSKEISKENIYLEYTAQIKESRRSMIPGHKTGKIKRNVKETPIKPRRIFKATKR